MRHAVTLKKMEARCSSETSVYTHRATWHYISADRELFMTTAVRTSNPVDELDVIT
jgi:hypothetical protein